MKVLHLATSEHGGAGIAAVRLSQALRDIGCESILAVREDYKGADEVGRMSFRLSTPRRLQSKATSFLDASITRSDAPSFNSPLSTSEDVSGLIHEVGPDIIHIHNTFNFIGAGSLRRTRMQRCPAVITLHDERIYTGGCHHAGECFRFESICGRCPQIMAGLGGLAARAQKRQVSMLERLYVKSVVAPSAWIAERARESSVLRGTPIEKIPNCLSRDFLAEPPLLGAPEVDEFVIGWVPPKGSSLIQEALGILTTLLDAREAQRLRLRMTVGGPVVASSIGTVRVAPPTDEKSRARFWVGCSVGLFASEADNFPNVLLEGLAMGVPQVVVNVGGAAESIVRTGGGIVVGHDPSEMAAALLRMIRTRSLLLDLAQSSLTAREIYSPSKVARIHMRLYESLI